MRQSPSRPTTRYEVAERKPTEADGYPQRIRIWEIVQERGNINRSELLRALQEIGYARPQGAVVDEAYCRIELTDMTKRGFLRRIYD